MSKYLIIGDIHCRPDNLNKVNELFNIIESKQLPVILLGDVLDTKEVIRGKCLNLIYNRLKSSKLKYNILVGNHCWFNNEQSDHSLRVLNSLPNVRVIDTPTFLYNNMNVILVPYYRNPAKFLHSITFSSIEFVIGHQGVKEFTLGSGYTEDEAVDLKDLTRFKQVIMGHYHTPMDKGNVVYVGSPFSHSFGESNENKRLAIFHTDLGIIEYIPLDLPRHVSVTIDLDNPVNLQVDPVNHNRVILKGSKEQIDLFDKTKYNGVKFIEEYKVEEHKLVLKETETPVNLYTKWIKEVKKEDNQDIYKLGLDILNEVK